MKRIFYILLLNLTLSIGSFAQEQVQLTTEQKLADFDSLYFHYKEVFPYFEVNKRLHNVDWLENRSAYRLRIENTKNDKEYLSQINDIIGDLNCGHANLMPTKYYHYYYSRYKMASIVFWSYRKYVRELKKNGAKKKSDYWSTLYKELYPKKKTVKNDTGIEENSNVKFETDTDGSIAVMHIKSFEYDFIKQDKKALLEFYNKLKDYKYLIIDIQENGGGDTRYWQKNIVPYLSNAKINYPTYMAFRDSPEFYKFAGKLEGFSADSINLEYLPAEVRNEDYLVTKSAYDIKPHKKSIRYQGEIILLVDHGVYSSAEAFANFCATTGFAKVAGEITGGDGIGADPFIYTLPISRIATCHPGIMGLNADGSSNEEMGTRPEIKVTGVDSKERYIRLLEVIKDTH